MRELIKYFHKKNLLDVPDARKHHSNPTPSSGGIVFIVPLLIGGAYMSEHLLVVLSAIVFLVVGFIDDRRDLSSKIKFLVQFVIAALAVSQYGSFPFFEEGLFFPEWLATFASIVLVVGIINAFNLIDGSDGLAGTYALIAFVVFTILFYTSSQFGLAYFAGSMAIGLFVFLQFNLNPAKIFMGDAGSLCLGYLLSILGLQLTHITPTNGIEFEAIVIPLLLVPAMDTIRVMLWRIIQGKKPFDADRTHIHHILSQLKISPISIANIFGVLSVSILFLAIVLSTQGFGNLPVILITSAVTVLMLSAAVYSLQIRRKIILKKKMDKMHQIESTNNLLKQQS